MMVQIKLKDNASKNQNEVLFIKKTDNLVKKGLTKEESTYAAARIKSGDTYFIINRLQYILFIQVVDELLKKDHPAQLESLRGTGNKICLSLNTFKHESIYVSNTDGIEKGSLAVAEGIALSNYQFLKYRTGDKQVNSLKSIFLSKSSASQQETEHLQVLTEEVFRARNWVNEPQSYLDAVTFANEMKQAAKSAGVRCEVLTRKQLETLKMGGILAVNAGSKTPPTFTILEYKPSKPKNKKPLVLVGKGVVYDTGGLSLKPTSGMDTMKCDMAGGAAVASAILAIARQKLPVHVVALIPATDNRPGENAYTPGDVINMYDGKTVEVLNTDAEGRLLLADALSYAKKFNPELVLDFATLTGAAAAAIGQYGIVCMGTADEKTKNLLRQSGTNVHERLVEFPFWDDYAALLKSDIADMKNIGGPVAGAITAGKFLEKFTDYPWMHFDIAGPAFINSPDSYRGKGGTGTAVRLIAEFAKNMS